MYGFTEAEERFIEATIPVMEAGDAIHQATERMAEAQLAAKEFGQALELDASQDGVANTTRLMLEAARRAGFDEESPVVQSLREAEKEILAEIEFIDELRAEQATAKANPVI